MKIDRRHWLLIGAAILMASVGFYGGYRYLSVRRAEVATLTNEVRVLQSQVSLQDEAREILDQLRGPFAAAFERGWWQPQNRLDWLESADRFAKELGLPLLRYQLSPQQNDNQANGLNLLRTAIQLELGLVHEGQLLDFWRLMENAKLGLLSLESCRFWRSQASPVPGQANLQASCKMDWITITREPQNED